MMKVAAMDDWTAGDYGGVFAAVVAGIIGLAKLVGSAIDWIARRTDKRAVEVEKEKQQLAEWRESLTRREREYREALEAKFAEIEGHVAELRTQNAALGVSLFDVTHALNEREPAHPALTRVAATLRAAFPLDDGLPPNLAALLARLNLKDPGK